MLMNAKRKFAARRRKFRPAIANCVKANIAEIFSYAELMWRSSIDDDQDPGSITGAP
jgi:hypothetical protein